MREVKWVLLRAYSIFLLDTRDRWLKVSCKGLGNDDKARCPRADWEQRSYHPSLQEGRQTIDIGNYRSITLLSISDKVFCRMILNRIQVTIDNHLTEEQCGFRSSTGNADAVFVVRQIIEKAGGKTDKTPLEI